MCQTVCVSKCECVCLCQRVCVCVYAACIARSRAPAISHVCTRSCKFAHEMKGKRMGGKKKENKNRKHLANQAVGYCGDGDRSYSA